MNHEEMLTLIKTRRSCRSYRPDAVPEDVLDKVLEAGTYAPTGGGRQSPVIIAVRDSKLRSELSAMNAEIMGGDSDPYYGAPVVVLVLAEGNTFVEDGGWHRASQRYGDFVHRHQDADILYLELGEGMNTPGTIKFNFWQQGYKHPNATYGLLNPSDGTGPRAVE